MDWNFRNDQPIYSQLTQRLTEAIVSGIYAPGEKLPSVRELAVEAGVNPNTVQRALAELERDGLVFSQRTTGRFVTENENMIVNAKLRVFCSGLAIVDRLHLEALAFQNGTDGLRHHFFILDHQHFHTYVPYFVRLFDESTIRHFPEIKLKAAVKVFKKAVFFSASVQHGMLIWKPQTENPLLGTGA